MTASSQGRYAPAAHGDGKTPPLREVVSNRSETKNKQIIKITAAGIRHGRPKGSHGGLPLDLFQRKELYSMDIKKGDMFYADLTPALGSEQGGIRPVLIIQNDVGNRFSPTVIVTALTKRARKRQLPTHVRLGSACGLRQDSMAMLEQIRTIDRSRLKGYIGRIECNDLRLIDQAMTVSLGLERSGAAPANANK